MASPNYQWWDFGRFLRTLWFFDAFPFLKDCPLIQQWFGRGDRPATPPESPAPDAMAVHPLMDFTHNIWDQIELWGALDDVVMGGVSKSQAQVGDNALIFSGEVSTANFGGFSSIRTRNFEPPLDLSGWEGIELQVRGDGNRYKFFVRGEERWDSTAHAQSFDTVVSEWQTVRLPFSEFVAVFRAKTVPDSPLNLFQVYAFQLMLSKFEYDGTLNPHFTSGAFRLEVRAIAVYR